MNSYQWDELASTIRGMYLYIIRLHIWGVVKNQGVVQGILRTTQNPTEVRRTQWVRRTSFDPSQNLFSWF